MANNTNIPLKFRRKQYNAEQDNGEGVVVFNTKGKDIFVAGQEFYPVFSGLVGPEDHIYRLSFEGIAADYVSTVYSAPTWRTALANNGRHYDAQLYVAYGNSAFSSDGGVGAMIHVEDVDVTTLATALSIPTTTVDTIECAFNGQVSLNDDFYVNSATLWDDVGGSTTTVDRALVSVDVDVLKSAIRNLFPSVNPSEYTALQIAYNSSSLNTEATLYYDAHDATETISDLQDIGVTLYSAYNDFSHSGCQISFAVNVLSQAIASANVIDVRLESDPSNTTTVTVEDFVTMLSAYFDVIPNVQYIRFTHESGDAPWNMDLFTCDDIASMYLNLDGSSTADYDLATAAVNAYYGINIDFTTFDSDGNSIPIFDPANTEEFLLGVTMTDEVIELPATEDGEKGLVPAPKKEQDEGKFLMSNGKWEAFVMCWDEWNDGSDPLDLIFGRGLFSVNANGDKIRFAKGNLQYNAALNKFRIAQNEYDTIGSGNENIGATYNGFIDLFGFATSGWTGSGATAYMPYSSSITNSDYFHDSDLTGTYADADWCVFNEIFTPDLTESCKNAHTLSHTDFDYIIHTRATGVTVGGVSDARYAPIRIDDGQSGYVFGLLIFPDGFELPTGLTFTNVNTTTTFYYPDNAFTLAEFEMLQNAGCAFLPIAGERNGTSVPGAPAFASYRTTSRVDSDYSYVETFPYNDGVPFSFVDSSQYNYMGYSVRPVINA